MPVPRSFLFVPADSERKLARGLESGAHALILDLEDSVAAANLPAGHFELTKNANHLRLEWRPDKRQGIGVVAREITGP